MFNFNTYNAGKQKSSFKFKLFALVKSVVPYYYPEGKGQYIPDFEKPVLVEKRIRKNLLEYLKASLKIKRKLNLKGLEETYNNLTDEYSREMMLRVIVYNLFPDVKLRFPLYYSEDFEYFSEYEKMRIGDEEKVVWFGQDVLKKYDLSDIGFNLKMWYSVGGIFIDFIREQYAYRDIVRVEPGDYVIDAGGCYGDTALYFAAKAGENGRVFSFEFLPENIEIFQENMQMNPDYAENIVLINKPVGKVSGERIFSIPNGPGSSISEQWDSSAAEYHTVSIDDYVMQNAVEKIDFIKMDIEGSEAAALMGSEKTIKKFKPKLAICVYHKKDDLWTLPQLIKSLVPEYQFYLNHHTISGIETVLYCRVPEEK